MGSEWRKERFGDIVEFISTKQPVKNSNLATYISTENMLPEFGGVALAASLPNGGSVTQFRDGDTLFSNIRTYFKKVWQANFDGYSCI